MLKNEMYELLGIKPLISKSDYCLTVLSQGIIKIQGQTMIEVYNTVKIILKIGKNRVSIFGEKLKLKILSKNELTIIGEIKNIEL